MAYELFGYPNESLEVRCIPGDIVHITYDRDNDTWTVIEDESHEIFHTRGKAVDRAREIGKDPDFTNRRAG